MATTDQFSTFASGMRTYYKDLNAHYESGGDMPMFTDVVGNFDYSDILDDSQAVSKKAVTPAAGALADSVHNISAIMREFGIRTTSRYGYFVGASGSASGDASYFHALGIKYGSMFQGRNPDIQ